MSASFIKQKLLFIFQIQYGLVRLPCYQQVQAWLEHQYSFQLHWSNSFWYHWKSLDCWGQIWGRRHVNLYKWCSTFIIGIDDGSKSLLSSGVPYLHFNYFLIDVDRLESEVNSDSDHIILTEFIVCKTKKKWTFTNCRISYHNEFE